MTLAQRLARVDRGPVVAYSALVELWRTTFDADVARAAARVADAITTPDAGWAGKPDARQAKWLALAPRAEEVLVRLELLRHTDFENDRARDLIVRIEAMAGWPHDPLVARWLVDAFARQTRAPFLEGGKCFRRAFAALEAILDRDGAERFAGWLGTHEKRIAASAAGAAFFDAGMKRVLANAEPRLRAASAVADHDRAALVASGLAVERARPEPPKDEAALYTAVLASPRDDGARMVLADALSQRGDPRGEFIALELLAERTAEHDRRRNALLKAHAKQWVSAELRRVINTSTLRWQRGFPASAGLKTDRQTSRDLATFRELDASSVQKLPAFEPANHAALESVIGIPVHLARSLRDRAVWRSLTRIGVTVEPTRVAAVAPALRAIVHPGVRGVVVDLAGDLVAGYTRHEVEGLGFVRAVTAIAKHVDARHPQVDRLELFGIASYARDRGGKLVLGRVGVPWWLRHVLFPRYAEDRKPAVAAAWLRWIATATGDVHVIGPVDDAIRAALGVPAERLRAVRGIADHEPLIA